MLYNVSGWGKIIELSDEGAIGFVPPMHDLKQITVKVRAASLEEALHVAYYNSGDGHWLPSGLYCYFVSEPTVTEAPTDQVLAALGAQTLPGMEALFNG